MVEPDTKEWALARAVKAQLQTLGSLSPEDMHAVFNVVVDELIKHRLSDSPAALVTALGEQVGYGHMMLLAEQCWRKKLETVGMAGAEYTHGPCAAMVVPCPCMEGENPGKCDWCCGAGRVTERVLQAMAEPEGHEEEPDGERLVTVPAAEILSLVNVSEMYGFGSSVLMDAFAAMLDRECSDAEIQEYGDSFVTPEMRADGYGEEDRDGSIERLTEWRNRYCVKRAEATHG